MHTKETINQRSKRIIGCLLDRYPGKKVCDLDGRGEHFVCEVEPVDEHPNFDKAIEVIISSKPHKHSKATQYYRILSGNLELHVGEKTVNLRADDKYTIKPNNVHWARSKNEALVEIYSTPGWTKEDHILCNSTPGVEFP